MTPRKCDRINIGIVGCGAVAQEHLRALTKMNTLRLVSLCDPDERTVARVANKWKIDHYYTKFSEMLDNEQISLVSILTPPQSHASLALEAITRRVNVLVEKPLTMTTSDADLVLKSLARSSVKLTVNYNWLLSRAMMKALSLVANQEVGDILEIDIKTLHTAGDEMASNEKHWSHKLPGGRFGEMLSHPVYIAQSVLGKNLNVDRILAEKRGNFSWMRYDELHVSLRSNRGIGHIYVSFNAPRPAILVDIFGTAKILKIDVLNQTLIELRHRMISKMDSAIDCLNVSRELFFQTIRNSLAYFLVRRGESALQMAYRSLVHSMTKNQEPIVTPEMAFSTVKIVEEICNEI